MIDPQDFTVKIAELKYWNCATKRDLLDMYEQQNLDKLAQKQLHQAIFRPSIKSIVSNDCPADTQR